MHNENVTDAAEALRLADKAAVLKRCERLTECIAFPDQVKKLKTEMIPLIERLHSEEKMHVLFLSVADLPQRFAITACLVYGFLMKPEEFASALEHLAPGGKIPC